MISGQCGDNVTWTFDNGELRIEGTGAMWDYNDTYNDNFHYKKIED